jgi:hypothetical protein
VDRLRVGSKVPPWVTFRSQSVITESWSVAASLPLSLSTLTGAASRLPDSSAGPVVAEGSIVLCLGKREISTVASDIGTLTCCE